MERNKKIIGVIFVILFIIGICCYGYIIQGLVNINCEKNPEECVCEEFEEIVIDEDSNNNGAMILSVKECSKYKIKGE